MYIHLVYLRYNDVEYKEIVESDHKVFNRVKLKEQACRRIPFVSNTNGKRRSWSDPHFERPAGGCHKNIHRI